jgi:hypothetical protein
MLQEGHILECSSIATENVRLQRSQDVFRTTLQGDPALGACGVGFIEGRPREARFAFSTRGLGAKAGLERREGEAERAPKEAETAVETELLGTDVLSTEEGLL